MSHIQEKSWPVLTSYDQSHLTAIALPLGGRGDLRQWEIVNRPSRHFIPKHSFFALYTRAASGQSRTKVLEGRLEHPYEGAEGSPAPWPGCRASAIAAMQQLIPWDRFYSPMSRYLLRCVCRVSIP